MKVIIISDLHSYKEIKVLKLHFLWFPLHYYQGQHSEKKHYIINHDLSRRPITLEQGLVLWNQNVSISLYNRPDKSDV